MRLVESSIELQTKVDDVDEIKSLHRLVRACTYSSRSVVNLYASNRVSFFNALIICRTIAIGNKPPSQNRIAAAAAIEINAHDRSNEKSCRRLLMQQLSHTKLMVHVHVGTFSKDQPNDRREKFKNNSRQAITDTCSCAFAWAWLPGRGLYVQYVQYVCIYEYKVRCFFLPAHDESYPLSKSKVAVTVWYTTCLRTPRPCVYRDIVLVGMRACKRR